MERCAVQVFSLAVEMSTCQSADGREIPTNCGHKVETGTEEGERKTSEEEKRKGRTRTGKGAKE